WNYVAPSELLQYRRPDQLDFGAMTACVYPAIVPTEAAPHAGIASVADAGREAMFSIRLRGDRDRDGALVAIGFAALDVDGREVQAVVEHVLRAKQRIERVRISRFHAQHASHRIAADHVLRDRDLAVMKALSRIEHDRGRRTAFDA